MSGEIIAILSVGIGLGLLSTGLFAWTDFGPTW